MQQKQIMEGIRLKVKLITDRRRRNRALQSRQRGSRETSSPESASHSGRLDHIARSTPDHDASTTTRRDREQDYTVSSQSSLPEDNAILCSSGYAPLTPQTSSDRTTRPRQSRTDTPSNLENHLLMLYLDKVIPNQFPFYSPSTAEGGRGWLFCLLMKSRPLYKAALAMAAVYCQQSPSTVVELNPAQLLLPDIVSSVDHLYVDAIGELRDCIGSLSLKRGKDGLKEGIHVLACIVHLILLEVSTHPSRW
jgi:hypothetical protein